MAVSVYVLCALLQGVENTSYTGNTVRARASKREGERERALAGCHGDSNARDTSRSSPPRTYLPQTRDDAVEFIKNVFRPFLFIHFFPHRIPRDVYTRLSLVNTSNAVWTLRKLCTRNFSPPIYQIPRNSFQIFSPFLSKSLNLSRAILGPRISAISSQHKKSERNF